MTCKPILQFLEENGIAPTKENKKRWQAGWTLTELKRGEEFVMKNYVKSIEKEFGENFVKKKEVEKRRENEKRIMRIIEEEKKRKIFSLLQFFSIITILCASKYQWNFSTFFVP